MTEPVTLTLPSETIEAIVEQVKARVLEEHELNEDRRLASSPYMSVDEASVYLRCSRQRVHDLLSARRLRRYKDGSRTLVSRAELEQYVREVD